MSTSVYATSTPSAVKDSRLETCAARAGVSPTMKWPCSPTPSILIPRALRDLTRFCAAVALAPGYSML